MNTLVKKINENDNENLIETKGIVLQPNESLITNVVMKTSIFSSMKKSDKRDTLVDRKFNLYGYDVRVKGDQLNNDKDLFVFLYLVKKGEKKLRISFKEILTELRIINEKTRINSARKNIIIKSLEKLNSTSISVKSNKCFSGENFVFVSCFSYDNEYINIELSQSLFNMYTSEFTKIIKMEKLFDMTQFERSMYMFFKSFNTNKSPEIYFNLDNLHERFNFSAEKRYFVRDLNTTLQKLVDKKIIVSFFVCPKQNIAYINFKRQKVKRISKTKEIENYENAEILLNEIGI